MAVIVGAAGWASLLAFGLAGAAAGSAVRQLVLATRRQGRRGLVGRANGGMIVHLGVIMIAVALVASNAYTRSATLDLEVGTVTEWGGHRFELEAVREEVDERARVVVADVRLDGGEVYQPATTKYLRQGIDIGTPSVSTGVTNDVYLTLERGAVPGADGATIRVFTKPLILWLWIGGAVDGRRHAAGGVPRRPPSAPDRPGVGTRPRCAGAPGAGACLSLASTSMPAGGGASPRSWRWRSRCCSAACSSCWPAPTPSTEETADTPLLDRPAPEAIGELADGTPFELARRKGDWVIVNFFQSSCVPCQQEHPDLVRFVEQQEALGASGAKFYTVVYDDERPAVEAFFAAEGGDWPVVYDADGSIAVAFGVAKVPETWIIDPNGIVRGRIISRVTAENLANQLQLLRERLG